jgi:hypothetical protein
LKYLIGILLTVLSVSTLLGDDVYRIYPFSHKVQIDGKAKEQIWSQLPFSEFFVPTNGNSPLKCSTQFKLYSDKESIFVLIEFKGQKLSEINSNSSKTPKDKQKLLKDNITLFIAPRPEIDDHYKISIDFAGFIEDCFLPEKAGHGYPYTVRADCDWDSKIKCAVNTEKDSIFMELEIPIEPLALQKNLFNGFGFNIIRNASIVDGKKTINESSSWSHVNGDIWDTKKFGLLQGMLFKEPQDFTKDDFQNLDQMTNGMTALLKSLDIYYKATISYKDLIPEGTEVNGDISNFDHVPVPQYPVKADGYYRFYNALKYQPYKDLGNHIVNKLYRLYQETKDANGKSFILWNNLMDKDGKVYGYGSGHKMIYFAPGTVPYNQSKNKFNIKDVVFQDALGQGFLDLSEIKETLDPEIQSKLIEMLNGTLEFLHQPYVLVKRNDEYFWRIDSFAPYEPKPFEGKLNKQDWSYLGQDIVLMYMALQNFDSEKAKIYSDSMVEFSKFYISGRLNLSKEQGAHQPHNIYKLDHRMLSLAKFAKEKSLSQFDFLDSWLMKELPKIYEVLPKIEYSENGATNHSWSTQAMLEVYRLLGLKKQCQKFWELTFDNNMKRIGIFSEHRILPMNFSSYPLYFDYSKKSFDSGILDENKFKIVFQKMFLIYGNPSLLRNNLSYALDLTPNLKNKPMWGNAPYDSYIEGVLPEGIYANGSAQAFYTIYNMYNSKEDFSRYAYFYRYYQYTAPFQYHSDRYSYGKAESYALIKMPSDQLGNLVDKGDEKTYSIEVETPNLPEGMPIFGHLDISSIMYKGFSAKTPSELKPLKIQCNGQALPFKEYQVFEYDDIFRSEIDKAKLVFGLWNTGPNKKVKVEVVFKKKQLKQYFSLSKDK